MKEDLVRECEAVRRGAGYREACGRVLIEVLGPDRISFLHSMISHDVQALVQDHGRYSTFLTATGKMIADFYFYKLGDRILIDVRSELADGLQESLEKFVIMDDVTFQRSPAPQAAIALHGPDSSGLLREFLAQDPPSGPHQIRRLQPRGWLIHRPQWRLDGFQIRLFEEASDLAGWLRERGVLEIRQEVAETLRIEAFEPRFGLDMDQDNNPLEAGLHAAYSLTKGCYVGQEVVAKATHVGGVNRVLVGLLIEGDSIPAQGSPILDGDRRVGRTTSACYSPILGAPLALGYVRRSLVREGARVRIEQGSHSLQARLLLESAAGDRSSA